MVAKLCGLFAAGVFTSLKLEVTIRYYRQFPIHGSQDDDRNARGSEANLQVTDGYCGVQVCRVPGPPIQRPRPSSACCWRSFTR